MQGSSSRRLALACAVASWVAIGAAPPELDAPGVLGGVQRWLDGTRDLEARFEQSLTSGALATRVEESGKLALLRPGRMRWDYVEPERKIALVDGDRTRLYLAEDHQLWEGSLQDGEAILPALLLGERRMADLFEASLVATPRLGGDGAYRLRLVPRQAAETFGEVVLTVRAPEWAIEQAEVQDEAGSRIVYRFRALARNRGIAPSRFHFEPPPGTEIVTEP